jgi:hypothetical protein
MHLITIWAKKEKPLQKSQSDETCHCEALAEAIARSFIFTKILRLPRRFAPCNDSGTEGKDWKP